MTKSKVDDFLEVFSEGELFDLVFSTIFPPLEEEEEEEEKQEQEKKKRKKRKAKVKKDSPKPPKISEDEVDEEGRVRRRRRKRGDGLSVDTLFDTKDFNPYEGRRRMRRGEKVEVEKKTEPKIIPYPLPERQAEIEQLTQEIANQTALKFLECIPPEIKEVLTEEQLKFQQYELSMGIAEAVRSKLEWAMNQAW